MTLTVGIDGYNLALPSGTGIATYGRTLATAVQSNGWDTLGLFGIDAGQNPATREFVFFDRLAHPPVKRSRWAKLRDRLGRLPELVEVPLAAVDQRPLAERIPPFKRIITGARLFDTAHRYFQRTGRLATISVPNPPTIMHWTCPLPLQMAGTRNVYTLHDLVPLKMPYMTLDNKALVHAVTTACIAAADHLCAVSQATADDVLGLFPAAAGKISTTYQSYDIVDAKPLDEAESERIVVRMGLTPGSYFLFYGAVEPKKNLARLIEAHARMATTTPLVIASGRSWNAETEQSLLDRMGATSDRLTVLEYLPRTMLQALIRHARAVTFPSLHEGFGLPVLEAMRLGAPVLTGSCGALTEVAGDAAVRVDPLDIDSIKIGLERIDQDATLRQELSDRGRTRAEAFSPANYSAMMRSLYLSLCSDT